MARRPLRLLLILALGALVLPACGGGGSSADVPVTVVGAELLGDPVDTGPRDDGVLAVSATPDQQAFVRRTADAVVGLQSYRAEMWMDATVTMDGVTTHMGSAQPLATMAVAGPRQAVTMRLGELLASGADSSGTGGTIDAELLDQLDSWIMDIVIDGTALYLRQSVPEAFADAAGAGNAAPDSVEALLTSGEWLSVDTLALGVDAGALAASRTNGTIELALLARLVSGDRPEVAYLGPIDVRGQMAENFRITTTMREVAAFGGGLDAGSLPATAADELADTPVTVTVALDVTGRPVRAVFEGDLSVATSTSVVSMTYWQAIEYFAFDDPTIVVEVPAGATDATAVLAPTIRPELSAA